MTAMVSVFGVKQDSELAVRLKKFLNEHFPKGVIFYVDESSHSHQLEKNVSTTLPKEYLSAVEVTWPVV